LNRPFATARRIGGAVAVGSHGGREGGVDIEVVVQSQSDLLEVVLALGAARRLAGLLDGGQQQGDQDGDDGDHYEQFDESEATTVRMAGNQVVSPERDRGGPGVLQTACRSRRRVGRAGRRRRRSERSVRWLADSSVETDALTLSLSFR